MRPSQRSGAPLNTIAPGERTPPPEAMIRTAPSVGSSEARPGYAVVGWITTSDATRSDAPNQPMAAPSRPTILPTTGAATARRPPAESCQARVANE